MSRIGKKPGAVPKGVTANVQGQTVKVKGPKGELSFSAGDRVSVAMEGEAITVEPRGETKQARAEWGMARTRIANLMTGVTKGYEQRLEINGVGYRATVQGQKLDLALGYIPSLDVQRTVLWRERYVVVMRRGHPLAKARPTAAALAKLEYALVRAHPATTRALHDLGLADRIRLSIPHFMVLPRILAETDLAVVMPPRLYAEFERMGRYAMWRPRVGFPSLDVPITSFVMSMCMLPAIA